MQHPALRKNLTESPFTAFTEGEDQQSGMHFEINDKPTTNTIIKQMTKKQLPPTQMAHDLNEPKNSEKISNLTTKTKNTNSDRMPHSPESDGGDDDDIDCAIAVQKKNHHELIPAPNGSQQAIIYENGSSLLQLQPSTPPTSAYHKDGHYFLKLLQSEKSRLLTMADQAERDMCALTNAASETNNEISDEVFGILRSVSGKTKLLVSQKFKQFEGLCHSNLNPTPDEKFSTTIADLLGFWDMVYLQIEHIDSLFKELDLIKANNWQPTKDPASPFVPTGSRLMKKSSAIKNGNNNVIAPIKISPNALLMAQKRDTQRKQLLELKRKNRSAAATDKGQQEPIQSSPIEIFVSENSL